jgi:methionyl-tRNA formyltransferase
MRLIFIGSSFFSCIFLLTLLQANFSILLIVSSFLFYKKHKVLFLTTEFIAYVFCIPLLHSSFLLNFFCFRLFYNLRLDFIILASCSILISQEFLKLPRFGFLNIHASLLPRFPGPNPIRYSVLLSDSIFGISIIFITSTIDVGPILSFTFNANKVMECNVFFFYNYFSFLASFFLMKYSIFYSYGCVSFLYFFERNKFIIVSKKLMFSLL